MLVTLAVGSERPVTFIRSTVISEVDSYNSDTNGVVPLYLEMLGLLFQIVHDSIYLFNHRFEENLYFDTNLNVRNRSERNFMISISCDRSARHQFSKTSVATPRSHADSAILRIQNSHLAINPLNETGGTAQLVDILIKFSGYRITESGTPMPILCAVKQPAKSLQ